jgi:hypothetical protein
MARRFMMAGIVFKNNEKGNPKGACRKTVGGEWVKLCGA